jgi:hypothetical protein
MRKLSILPCLLVWACNGQPAERTAHAAAPGAAAAPAAKKYELRVDAPGTAKASQRAVAAIVLRAAPGFHLNQEFPLEIGVSSEQVKIEKSPLRKADAKKFDKEEGRFEIAYVTDEHPGENKLTAKVRFAVCTDKDCWPVNETLSWTTVVK